MKNVAGVRTDRTSSSGNVVSQLLGKQWLLLLLISLLLALFTGLVNNRFFNPANLMNILEQISVLGLVAAGATILIISGNFDISVGAMIGLSVCIMAMLMNADVSEPLASLIGILVCVTCSVLNGFLSVVFRAPSFIITLATMGVYHGIALALTQGVIQTIYGKFEVVAGTRLLGVLPLVFVISLAGYALVHVLLTYTQLGRRVYAIGDNARAAFLAGIRVRANTLVFFAISGFLVGVAAMSLLSRVGSATPSTGEGIELRAIGAVVIGGVPITGGKGNVMGTFFGVLLMGVISNTLNMLRVNPYFQEMAFGALIILAVAVSYLRLRFSKT
jgi:ribose transport system permease protein